MACEGCGFNCGAADCPCDDCSIERCCCEYRQGQGESIPCLTEHCGGASILCPNCNYRCDYGCCCLDSYKACIENGGDIDFCIQECEASALWVCRGGSCQRDARSTTGYGSESECQAANTSCQPKVYACVYGICEVGSDAHPPEFATMEQCADNCGRWSCKPPWYSGGTITLDDFGCGYYKGDDRRIPGWNVPGIYRTKTECETLGPTVPLPCFNPTDTYLCVRTPGNDDFNGTCSCQWHFGSGDTLANCRSYCGRYDCTGSTGCTWVYGRIPRKCDPTIEQCPNPACSGNYWGGGVTCRDVDQNICDLSCKKGICCSSTCSGSCQERLLIDCGSQTIYSSIADCQLRSPCCGNSRYFACESIPGTAGDGTPGTKQCVQKIGQYTGVPGTYQTETECKQKCGSSWYCNTCKPCVINTGLNGSITDTLCNCPAKRYRCDLGQCKQDICGGTDGYGTLQECEQACYRWRCDVSTPQPQRTPCTKYPNTPNGYLSETECLNKTYCNTTPRYKCVITTCPNNPSKPITKTCTETYEEGPGTFVDKLECERSGCGNPNTSVTYNCNSNSCIPVNYCDDAYPGQFTDLTGPTGCQSNCWGWGCNMNLCSQIEGISVNHETCASSCHCKWKKQKLANGCSICTKLCGVDLGNDNPLCDQWGANCAPSSNYFSTETACLSSITTNNEGKFACVKGVGCKRLEDVLDTSTICTTYCNGAQCTANCKVANGFECLSGTCVPSSGCNIPQYPNEQDCEKICEYKQPVGYNCELRNVITPPLTQPVPEYQCVPSVIMNDEGGGTSSNTPEFPTLALCKTFCMNTGVRGWYCSGNDCVYAKETAEINGKTTFATYAECAVSCIIPNQSPCGNLPKIQTTNIQSGFDYMTKLNNNG